MKRILNVMNLKTELDKQKIEAELELTRLTFTVSLANQCVIVDGWIRLRKMRNRPLRSSRSNRLML